MKKGKKFFTSVLKSFIVRYRRDLGIQIAFFYSLFVVPVMVIGFMIGRNINVRLQAEVMTADLALARAIAQETELNITNARFAAQELARYSAVNDEDQEAVEELYTRLMGVQSGTNPLSLLSDWWVIWDSSLSGLDVVPPGDFPARNFIQRSELTSPTLSNGWLSSAKREPVVTSVIPLWDELGNKIGLVVSNLKLEVLSGTLSDMITKYRSGRSEGVQTIIIDKSKKIIAHHENKLLLRSTQGIPNSVVSNVLGGIEGNQVGESGDGQEMLYSFAPIPSTDWGVIISRPTEVAFATSQVVTRSMLIVVVVYLGVGMVFWVGLSRQVIRPMEKLAAFSQSISTSRKLSKVEREELTSLAKRQDQVGYLTATLVNMELDIQARLNELATLLRTSAAVVSTLESQAVLDRILEQVEQLLDVEMSAIVALERLDGTFRTQASRGISQNHAAQLTVDPRDSDSIILQSLRGRVSVQIRDVENSSMPDDAKKLALQVGYRSVMAIPLQTLYAPPSALLIFRAEPYDFSDREISLLTNFANHAAMAIENATLYARSDMRLQEQTRRLEALIQSLRDGLILENLGGKIVYANRMISQLTNIPSEKVIGEPIDEIVNGLLNNVKDAEEIKENLRMVPSSSVPFNMEFEIFHRGRKLNLRVNIFRVTDTYGVLMGRGLIFYDVTADRELDHMKSRLVSTVSHELRTPLASIKGYASTLLAEDVEWDDQSQREFLKIISSETDRLSAMITDLLDLSKIEAGSLAIQPTQVHLGELAKIAGQRAYPPPNGRLCIDLPADIPLIRLDKRLIEAVFRNLIENATKYASEESPIRISGRLEDGSVFVYVEDEGPGIPAQYQEHLFESFYQPDTGSTRTNSGFGLGLTICKGFVEAHGGQIWIEPCSSGACIGFSLPLDEDYKDKK